LKACVLEAVAKLEYKETATPEPECGEALVKIRASGICGSDIQRVWEKGTYHFPTIPGHEFSGEVVKIGEGVAESWIGQKVAVFPLLPCGLCAFCESGNYAQCKNYDYYGSRRDGGFAEYISVKEWNLIPVPDALGFDAAALCEPCAVAVHALGKADIPLGGTVVIFGAGAIGLMLGVISMMRGAKAILIDIDASRLDFARRFGVTHTINSAVTDPLPGVMELTGGCGADVCIEGTGVSAGLEGCLQLAKGFGSVVCMGNPVKGMSLTQNGYWEILRKELIIKGTWNSSYSQIKNDWKTALHVLTQYDFTPLITHRYDLSQCLAAFEMLRDRSEFCVKAMFTK